jgi:RNA polymerase sigma-B factor
VTGSRDRLLARYRATRDPALRQELVREFMPLARSLARRYRHTSEPMDDLVQVASIGLLKAIDRFDPAVGAAFSSFAVPTILGELRRHFRDRAWSVRVPRDVQERLVKVERVGDELCTRLGRTPTPAEIGAQVDASTQQVMEALAAAHLYRPGPLHRPHDDEPDGDPLARFGADDEAYAQTDTTVTVERLLDVLSAREREILWLRFHEDLAQQEIGRRVGASQMQVSRVIRRAIARLRDEADVQAVGL